jgi:hypothetical protein
MRSHKDLDVWKKSMDLVDSIYKVSKSFPNEELYSLTNQMRRAVISVPSNIAEGAARGSKNEFIQVILAGRAINDYMPKHVAEMAIKGLNEVGKVIKGSKVLIMGLTYKENVPDTRESPVKEMVEELKEFCVEA